MSIRESLVDAYNRNWVMYQDLIQNTTDKQWKTGDIEYLTPAELVYHVLDCVDFYTEATPKGYVWGHRFNIDWKKVTPEQLPTKEQTRTYLEELMKKVDIWLQGLDDSDLLSPEKAFPWTGTTKLGRAIYLLVHCRQHMGEINAELRRRGLARIKWR
ncbi:MAG: DinB family protein [Candidatus Bathyarchaeota archaeon]